MLQTRNGKRTGLAAIKIAVDMVKERLISKQEAILRIPADSLSHVLAPIFDRERDENGEADRQGLPAGPGAASGSMVLHGGGAVLRAASRRERAACSHRNLSRDLRGMIAAEGILTARGGVCSHAAWSRGRWVRFVFVARAICGLIIHAKTLTANGHVLKEGDFISIDGTAGKSLPEK